MSEQTWGQVDDYINATLVRQDEALSGALARSEAAGLPPISVTAAQGKLLKLFAAMIGARRVLEVGTLGGYSTIWLARGMAPDGQLITLELDAHHAQVARANLDAAGLGARCEVRMGPAVEALDAMIAASEAPFDLVFIDADKQSTPAYFKAALALTRPGALIIVDNVVRGGAILDADSEDVAVQGIRAFYALAAAEPRVEATAIQTVGGKHHDGFAVVRVIG